MVCESTGYDDAALLCIAARGNGSDLCGGLSGWTWGGCGYIEFLLGARRPPWVRPGHPAARRGRARITRRGCGQLAVSTHSFQAPGFYARFGYLECSRTPAYPRGYDQIHLAKKLGDQRSRRDCILIHDH